MTVLILADDLAPSVDAMIVELDRREVPVVPAGLAVFSPGGHQGENLSANFPRAPLGLAEAGLGAASS